MLLIGIAGGNSLAREVVAKAMKDAGVCGVSIYSDEPCKRYESSKTAARRLVHMNEMISATPAKGAECLVVSQVLYKPQAERIRELGGYVVHVEGVPSDEVPIVMGDLLVTATAGGNRHFVDGEAALSEFWARKGAA